MRVIFVFVAIIGAASAAYAQAGSSFITLDGLSRAPASVIHCVGANNVAVPCGTASQPIYVTGGGGLATAANQLAQVTSDQAIASAAGTQQDTAYSGGAGSLVALLKGLYATLSNGVTATPVVGIPASRSLAVSAAASTALFPVNPARRYLALQAPPSTLIWVNFLGGAAAPNGIDCIQLSAGTLYESGPFVTRGIVNVYSPIAIAISAWEG